MLRRGGRGRGRGRSEQMGVMVMMDFWNDTYTLLYNIWHEDSQTRYSKEQASIEWPGRLEVYNKIVGFGDVHTHCTEFGTYCIGVG